MSTETINVDTVKAVLVETLGVEDRADSLSAESALFGALPELDSMAVLEVLMALEQQFGITVDGEDVSAEAFETLGSLTAFAAEQRR